MENYTKSSWNTHLICLSGISNVWKKEVKSCVPKRVKCFDNWKIKTMIDWCPCRFRKKIKSINLSFGLLSQRYGRMIHLDCRLFHWTQTFITTYPFAAYYRNHYEIPHLSQLMKLWYLSHRRPAKAQASLRIRAVLPEPSLFAQMKDGNRRRVQPKIRHLRVWRTSLGRMKSAIISWVGSFHHHLPVTCERIP